MHVEPVLTFIKHREEVRVNKEVKKLPVPWTADPILQMYRFCNVHREDDRVTRDIARLWRTPHSGHKHLWFSMMLARFFNNTGTLEELPFPSAKWDVEKFSKKLQARAESGERVFNPAYIVSTAGQRMDKIEYVLRVVLQPAWEKREAIAPKKGDTLASFGARLQDLHGMKGFMTGQVVADMKYVGPLQDASDWDTWALSGPGSRRGLNRLCENPVDAPWKEAVWHETLMELRKRVNAKVSKEVGPLHAQDLQNCLCETDKYLRAKNGEGKPKQNYPGY